VGSIGDCGIYSFQVSKTVSAGEGGALVTNDPEVFDRAARFSDVGFLREQQEKMLGRSPRYQPFAAGQYRMNEFTGAVMRSQTRKLDRIVADYRDKGIRVTKQLQDLEDIHFRKLNDDGGLRRVVFMRTSNRQQRDQCIRAMEAENIAAGPMEGSVILPAVPRSEEHTSELQSHLNLVCRLLLEKKKTHRILHYTTIQTQYVINDSHRCLR